MKTNKNIGPNQPDHELTENDLEQVSGGFDPQPDPPVRSYIQKTTGQLVSGNKKLDPGVQVGVHKPG